MNPVVPPHPLLQILQEILHAQTEQGWLVGGAVRDLSLKRKLRDFDVALKGDVAGIARQFADVSGGGFFTLDEERGHFRVVFKGEGEQFDFAPLKGETIGDDLLLRDFTINAMALPLLPGDGELLDPLGGREDLEQQRIRRCSQRSFDDDPLRLLRCVRMAAVTGFEIEAGTARQLEEKASLIARPAAERVRDELFLTLAAPNISRSLGLLQRAGLLALLLPGHLPTAASIPAAERLEEIARTPEQIFSGLEALVHQDFQRETEAGVSVYTLAILSLLLPRDEAGIRRQTAALRLSNLSAKTLLIFSRGSDCTAVLEAALPSRRAMVRYLADAGAAGSVLPLAELARQGDRLLPLCRSLLLFLKEEWRPKEADLLLSGADVMALLGLSPGPEVGKALEELRDAESRGKIETAGDARAFLQKRS